MPRQAPKHAQNGTRTTPYNTAHFKETEKGDNFFPSSFFFRFPLKNSKIHPILQNGV
jgi:hypothetical protein